MEKTLPSRGAIVKARVGSKRLLILVQRTSEINGFEYIEGVELKEIGTAEAADLPSGYKHVHDGTLYRKGNRRTLRPEAMY